MIPEGTILDKRAAHAGEHDEMIGRILHRQSGQGNAAGAVKSDRLGVRAGTGGVSPPDPAADHNVCDSVVAVPVRAAEEHQALLPGKDQHRVVAECQPRMGIDRNSLPQIIGAVSQRHRDGNIGGRVVTGIKQRVLQRLRVIRSIRAVRAEALGGNSGFDRSPVPGAARTGGACRGNQQNGKKQCRYLLHKSTSLTKHS